MSAALAHYVVWAITFLMIAAAVAKDLTGDMHASTQSTHQQPSP
jgi:hypothetical protein